jgi:hypothetical protein
MVTLTDMQRVALALLLGLVAALVPIVSALTRERCDTGPAEDGPRYLVWTTDIRARSLQCDAAHDGYGFERVANASEANTRIADNRVVGLIVDEAALEQAPAERLQAWLGTGHALVGLDLTASQLLARVNDSPPSSLSAEELYEHERQLGLHLAARIARYAWPSGGSCGGTATLTYLDPKALSAMLQLVVDQSRCDRASMRGQG